MRIHLEPMNIICYRSWHEIIYVVIPVDRWWCCRWCSMARRTSWPFLSLFSGSMFMYRGRDIMCRRPWFGGMKSSMSSSQLTQVCAAGGATWLDEPLVFPFVSFLILGSCKGGRTLCVGGHGLGGMKSSMSSSNLTQLGAWGAAAWHDEPPVICSCGGQVLSPEDLLHLLRLVCGISPPKIHTNLRKFGIDLLINSVSSG